MGDTDLIFTDLDGPILDGKNRHYQCYKSIIEEGGGSPLPIEDYWQMKRAKINRKIILEASGYTLSYDVFFNTWLQRIEQPEYLALDELKPDAADTLRTWSSKWPVFLVTARQSENNLLQELSSLGILQYFHQILCCDFRTKEGKYSRIRDIPFDDAVFVGDTEDDYATASKCGIPFLAITTGLREPRYLQTPYLYKEISDINISTFLHNQQKG
jgi:phosphoglycolate phosphatase-like HAD superfamily hydrolase